MCSLIFFGDDGEFLILPYAENGEGACTGVDKPERLKWDGVSVVALGERVLASLEVSMVEPGLPLGRTQAFALATGAKTFRAFSKTRQQVSVDSSGQGDGLRVQFLHRDANFMYSAATSDPPEWTVMLPLDAQPEAVGRAVVGVLRAGGVAIADETGAGGGPVGADAGAGADDVVGYAGFKAALLSDYGVMAGRRDGPVEAVTGLLEEVGRAVCEDPRLFHCAIMTCALVCLDGGFLPDFLDEPARRLGDISGQLVGEDLAVYRADAAALRDRLAAGSALVETECPPDYFPGTWGPGVDSAWWDDLVAGVARPG